MPRLFDTEKLLHLRPMIQFIDLMSLHAYLSWADIRNAQMLPRLLSK
jgi:hypothetical protein